MKSSEEKEQRRIIISELPKEIPDFTSCYESKQSIVKKWLLDWIFSATKRNSLKDNDIIPNKSEISEHLGVSIGTVQNAIRSIEDDGYLKSKQRLGTMISGVTNPLVEDNRKSTSKREKTVEAIKIYLLQKNIQTGKVIPTARKMSEILNVSQNTVRTAYEYLEFEGIISSCLHRGKDSNRILKKLPTVSEEQIKNLTLKADTLVLKLTLELKQYFADNFETGDKIPSHAELANKFKVSVKTINDCIQLMAKDGILIIRRGRYGTILSSNPLVTSNKQNEIFAPATEAMTYNYKRIESLLFDLIKNDFKSGDKLPAMSELSKKFDVSTNTIRKALNNLSAQGYVTFGRGRYGGTFVIEAPEYEEHESYQWLSINPDYIN